MRRGLAVLCALLPGIACAEAQHRGPSTMPGIEWTKFVDPAEGAFSLDVPAGWQVSGGSRRMNAVEVRSGVDIVSPDGTIRIFYGDVGIPIYALPSPPLTQLGIGVGGVYSPGVGQQFIVMPYLNGGAFADQWGAQRVARSCGEVAPIGAQGRPDVGRGIDQVFAAYGVQRWIDAGEANFSCSLQGAPAVAYVFAATEMVRTQTSALWDVKSLVGYIAARSRATEANALVGRIVASFRVDLAWAARQQQMPAHTSAIVAATNQIVASAVAQNGRALRASDAMIVSGGKTRSNTAMSAVAPGR
ncbi:MAG TPA: hypothetical protein VKZ79_19595 [Alphaproteobacteria bacterium]|nr:hypothetical protein [Alphaproteobacteria bacterium]